MAKALFVCLQNAGRSQMSRALFERAAEGRHEARSAGTTPATAVHPEVVEVMREVGIDLADRVPRGLTEDDARWADVVVTMGCGDKCPYVPGRRYVDWDLAVREEIERRVRALVADLDRPG
jgi:arsenate reductase